MLGNFLETICWKKFFGNYILGKFCNPYNVNLLMETFLWKIRVDTSRFSRGDNYGTMIRYHTIISRQWNLEHYLSIPAAQIFLEQCEAKQAKL